jgi:hypothetical protein
MNNDQNTADDQFDTTAMRQQLVDDLAYLLAREWLRRRGDRLFDPTEKNCQSEEKK